jgi:hypothetical protein
LNNKTAWPQLRLSWWITIGIASIILITTLLLLAVVDQFARNYAQREAELRLKQLAVQMRDALDQRLQQRVDNVRELSKELSRAGQQRNFEDPAALRTVLAQAQAQAQSQFSDVAWVGMADTSGKVITGTPSSLEGRNAAQRPWFVAGQEALYVGESRVLTPLKQTLPFAVQPLGFVDIAMPVVDQRGAVRGVLGTHVNWEWARAIVQGVVSPVNQRYQAEVMIVRDDGLVLVGPKGMQQKIIATDSLQRARSGAAGNAGALVEAWGGAGGQRYITGYVRGGAVPDSMTGPATADGSAGLNWTILVRQSEHIALADILVLEKQLVIAAVLETLLLMICAVLLSYKLVAPMNTLSKAIESRAAPEDDYVPSGWAYYEFTRLSKAIGNLEKHAFGAPGTDLEPKVNARVRQIRAMVAGLPPAEPNRDRDLFQA